MLRSHTFRHIAIDIPESEDDEYEDDLEWKEEDVYMNAHSSDDSESDDFDFSDDDETKESHEAMWLLEKEKWKYSMLPPSDDAANIRPRKQHCCTTATTQDALL
jgi:hypothetical protein